MNKALRLKKCSFSDKAYLVFVLFTYFSPLLTIQLQAANQQLLIKTSKIIFVLLLLDNRAGLYSPAKYLWSPVDLFYSRDRYFLEDQKASTLHKLFAPPLSVAGAFDFVRPLLRRSAWSVLSGT